MTNREFNQFYNDLPSENDRSLFRSKVIKDFQITYDIFYNWLIGRTNLPKYGIDKLDSIMQKMKNNEL